MELSDQGVLYVGFSFFYCFVIYWGMKALYEIKDTVKEIEVELIKLNMQKEFKDKEKELETAIDKAQESFQKPLKKRAKK